MLFLRKKKGNNHAKTGTVVTSNSCPSTPGKKSNYWICTSKLLPPATRGDSFEILKKLSLVICHLVKKTRHRNSISYDTACAFFLSILGAGAIGLN